MPKEVVLLLIFKIFSYTHDIGIPLGEIDMSGIAGSSGQCMFHFVSPVFLRYNFASPLARYESSSGLECSPTLGIALF